MARWTTLAVLTLTLLLLAQELHCQSDDGSAQTRTTKTSRRRFRKVRRQQVRTGAADGEEGNEVHYQRSRVASTTDGDSSGSSSSSSAAFVPGRGARRRYTSRVSVRRRTSAAQPGATQPPVLEGSYFLPPGEEGGRRVFAWNGGRTAGVAGAGAAGVRTSGDAQSPPAAASPVVSRTYSSSYYYRSSGGDAAAEQQAGGSSAQAAGASYRGEPGFAGQPGSLSNVERSTYSRRVTYGTTSGGIPCADAAACSAAAAAQSAAQGGFSQEQVSQSQSQSGYSQQQTSQSQSQSQSQTGYSQQQASQSQSQSQLTAQQRAAARAAAYARRQQEYSRRRQEYARRQQQSSYEGSQYGRTRQQGGRGYGRRYGYGRGRGRGRQQGVSEETATYDRTFAGRTYDRTRGRDETEGGSTVVTRYPGRTVYRNSTGTYVTSTRTLPGGRTVTSFNYTERYPSPGGGVVTAVNRTSFRNRTVVTTTSQQVPSGGSTGSTVTYRNISSVTSYPQGGAPQVGTRPLPVPSVPVGGGSSVSGGGIVLPGGVGGGSSSSSATFKNVTVFRNESRWVSSAGGSQTSSSTTSGSEAGGGRLRPGRYRPGTTTWTEEEEEVVSMEEIRRAYQERNRLQKFGECVCNMLGTDASAGPCNPGTGQCNCLPNVQGRQCDRCVTNHWKIAIGNGCEPCACDPVGSLQEQCNEFDGQCQCKPGFGGRRCNQCQDNHWGNPRVECFPCDCNPYGSESQQCDRDTGLCTCKEGMGGNKCGECARGFKGQAPYCDACGECFDNWDRILTELRERTDYLVSEASKIKQGGASGAYQGEFEQMQEWLDQVRSMLGNATVEDNEVDRLQATIDAIRTNLTESESLLSVIESSVDDTTQRVLVAELQVAPLRGRADTLRQMALLLKENATLLQEANVDGALESTRQAKRRSEAAEQSVKDTERTLLSEAERQRRRTENLLSRAGQQFNQSEATNQDVIDQVNGRLDAFEREIPGINGQVCDGEGDPCDALCGGAGCNRCGGISCDDGAVTKASNALSVAEDAAAILTDREREVDNLFRGVSAAQRAADEAYNLAQMALTGAELNHNRTQETKLRVEELLIQITEFLSNDGASPEAIQRMAEQTLEKSISLRPEQITELARQINETISSLTNIQAILDETEQDLANARALKVRADTAKAAAEGILQTAQSVIAALGRADTAQQAAREAMESAEINIQLAEADLTAIASEAGEASRQANQSLADVTVLRVRQKDLIREFSRNELDVRAAVKEADLASDLAGKAQTNVAALEEAYQKAIDQLGAKSEASGAARERAGALLERATKLALLTQGQVSELNEMQSEFSRHEIQLEDLSMEVMALNARMDDYLATITKRHEYYRTCQS